MRQIRPTIMATTKAVKRLGIVLLCFLVASCATTSLAPLTPGNRPLQLMEDEKQLWKDARDMERLIEESNLLYRDNDLDSYLEGVLWKLLGEDFKTTEFTPHVKVIQNPFLNAFALPNGTIYLHTGILARMENEAQLATVLGHEATHFIHRHAVKEIHSGQNMETFSAILRSMAVVAGSALGGGQLVSSLGGLAGQAAEIWSLASVSGYSRKLENEADREGLVAMNRVGYDLREAPKVFEHFQQELDERKIKEPYFFGTHPRLQERIENSRKFIETIGGVGTKEDRGLASSEEFKKLMEPVLVDNALLNLKIGRLRMAQADIEKTLAGNPRNAKAYFVLGEIHRHYGHREPYRQRAMDAYQKALELDPAQGRVHRELGLLYRDQGRNEEARKAFENYLTLNPEALDIPIIRGYVRELEHY